MSISRSNPVQVAGYTNTYSQAPKLVSSSWSKISIGPSHVLAIRSNNTLWAWGLNTAGQLGDNTTITRSSPVQIGTPSYTWNDVSAGLNYSVGLRGDGLLFVWGINTSGQLGNILLLSTDVRSSPVQVGTSSWNAISAGGTHVVAIRSDKTLWAWGFNTQGQLGLGDTITRSSPVQVGILNSYISVSAGNNHTTTIDKFKRLYIWGNNINGQLGLSDTINRSSPVQVGTSSWSTVSAAYTHTLAISQVGLLFAWGATPANGQALNTSSPVQIGINSWVSVSSGNNLSMAVDSNRSLYAWGTNTNYQLGSAYINVNKVITSPILVGTLGIAADHASSGGSGNAGYIKNS